jgi:acetyltransferase-like isoleucine patch superfamily enzyme
MAYLTREELERFGFKGLGKNVRISTRAAIYDAHLMSFGDHSRVDDFCLLSGLVTIGRNVLITAYVNLAGGQAGLTIEDFAGVAYGSHVLAQTEDYSGETMTNSTVPVRFRKETKAPVRIGRHSIVGTNAVIFPGVTIGEGTSVSAMAVVTRDTQPWSIYAGVPARRVRERSRALLELEREYLSSEDAGDRTHR